MGKGIRSNPQAVVYELKGAVSLFQINPDIVHVLGRDRSLMIGTSGWSYTLQRAEASEKPGDPSFQGGRNQNESGTVSPVATGPSVFGVFEGRSPCQGIARELKIDVNGDCFKLKLRVTLYQDPKTQAPTTYKMEDSLHHIRWRTRCTGERPAKERGASFAAQKPIRMRLFIDWPLGKTEGALLLLKGDENVLFFLNQHGKPLAAIAEFSYTLHRRADSLSSAPAQTISP